MVLGSESNNKNSQPVQPSFLNRGNAYHHQGHHHHHHRVPGNHPNKNHYHHRYKPICAVNGIRSGLPKGVVHNGQISSSNPDEVDGVVNSCSNPSTHVNYDFLKKVCRERGVLFEDPHFPPSNRALFGKRGSPSNSSCSFFTKVLSSIAWMRPYEICSKPKFISESSTRFDVEQGEAIMAITASNVKLSSNGLISNTCNNCSFTLTNCSNFSTGHNKITYSSLLSAISCLTLTPKLLDRVVPSDQNFNPSTYSGIFRFRFWRFGEWVDIVIDDRLPTFKGRLLFLRSVDQTEFWAALLEKAYSKLYGNYESYLRNCFTAQTLQDLTGGIAQSFSITHHDGHVIYQMISSAVPRSTLLSVCISSPPPLENNNTLVAVNPSSAHHCGFDSSFLAIFSAMNKLQHVRLRNGLITRQSYSITGLARVRTNLRPNGFTSGANQNGFFHHQHNYVASASGQDSDSSTNEVILIRLRNAWGKGEWNGPWSERSWEWDNLSNRDKEELSQRCRDDGEFWMSFDDFLRFFTHLDLVHIGPDDWMQETTLHHKRPWRAVLARRRWRNGFNAGGSPEHKETFATNPQFHIHISKNGITKCHVVVSVTQFYITNEHPSESHFMLHNIGFSVYEVPPSLKRLTPLFIANHRPLDVTAFTSTRETVTFFTLPPGDFIIVPSVEKPHCETKFLLRILTDELSTIWEVNDDNLIFTDISIPKVIENTGQVSYEN